MQAGHIGLSLTAPRSAASGSAAVAINFGSRTPVGYGGHLMGYVGAGTLSITAGNSSGHWQIDADNHVCPKNGAGVFGSSPPTFAGPYSLNVTDGAGWTRTVNITILPNDLHIRIQANVPGDFYGPNEWYEAFNSKTKAIKGGTIWLRDGEWNVSNSPGYTEPWDDTQYGGTGRITVRSETVDNSVDANGYKNRRHGSKMNRIYFGQLSAGVCPFDFKDIYFYNSVAPAGVTALFTGNDGANASTGLTFDNCGFENAGSMSDVDVSNVGGLNTGSLNSSISVTNCTFYRLGFGVAAGGQALTATDNVVHYIRDADAFQIGNGTFNHSIKRNIAWDILPVTGGHCDFLQVFGLNGSGDLGQVTDNIMYGTSSQGIFITDSVSGSYTGGLIENNIMHVSGGNGLLAQPFAGITVQRNTVLNWDTINPTGINVTGGASITAIHNVSNSFSHTQSGGTITVTPNPQTVIAYSASLPTLIANIVAAFPNYVHPASATDFSITALKRYFTPGSVWFAANNNAGALDTTGARNAL